ncbi:MAG: hypothetical protein HRT45_02835 [Bdellovibrionales bacterium]|nr:hypothetical protein [Bdellovibrionales bacterium]
MKSLTKLSKTLLVTLISIAAIAPHASNADTLECQWLKTAELAEGFYMPAKITMKMNTHSVDFVEDTFTSRRYEPCWIGNHSSCYFGFDYERDEAWSLDEINHSAEGTTMTITSSWYWTAEMTWSFSTRVSEMQAGEATLANVSGDDGDGVWFNDQKFACSKK